MARNPSLESPTGRVPLSSFLAWFILGLAAGAPVAYGARSILGPRDRVPEPAAAPEPRSRPKPDFLSPTLAAEVERKVREGFAALGADRLLEAHDAFRRAVELAPWDARAHHGLGEFFRRIDRAEQAEPCYREALRADPRHGAARLRLARVLRDLGKSEEAASHLRELVKDPACDPEVWLELARNELRLARPREATSWLERYVAARPKSAYGLAHLGRARAETGDAEAAERHYRSALAVDPHESLAWLWLGQLLVAQGRKAEAEAALANFRSLRDVYDELRSAERDLLRRPNDLKALVRVAKARFQLGRYREAVRTLDRALEIAPEDAALRRLRDQAAGIAGEEASTEEAVTPGR